MGIFKKFLGLFGVKFTNDVSEEIVWPNTPKLLTEGRVISGGISPKPSISKPLVKPSGQGTIQKRPDSYSIGRIPHSMTISTPDYFLSDNEQYKEPKKTYQRDSRGRFKKKGSE